MTAPDVVPDDLLDSVRRVLAHAEAACDARGDAAGADAVRAASLAFVRPREVVALCDAAERYARRKDDPYAWGASLLAARLDLTDAALDFGRARTEPVDPDATLAEIRLAEGREEEDTDA
jgi:hypothetical protein